MRGGKICLSFKWRGESETYQDLFWSAAEVLVVLFTAVAVPVDAELVAVVVSVVVLVSVLPVSLPLELQ